MYNLQNVPEDLKIIVEILCKAKKKATYVAYVAIAI